VEREKLARTELGTGTSLVPTSIQSQSERQACAIKLENRRALRAFTSTLRVQPTIRRHHPRTTLLVRLFVRQYGQRLILVRVRSRTDEVPTKVTVLSVLNKAFGKMPTVGCSPTRQDITVLRQLLRVSCHCHLASYSVFPAASFTLLRVLPNRAYNKKHRAPQLIQTAR